MVSLIDTNIIVRYLVETEGDHFEQSREIMYRIRDNTLRVHVLSEVLMEVIFVLSKHYKAPLSEIVETLKKILNFPGVANSDKILLIDSLNTMLEKKIDYVDALICTKTKLQHYGWISFDADLARHCPRR